MELNQLNSNPGSVKCKKRVGRGNGSGSGTTAGRGMNGQKCRSGATIRAYFEGGQMPLSRRVPKRGFTNIFKKDYAIVNIEVLNQFDDGAKITPDMLIDKGLIKKTKDGLKVLSRGNIQKKLTVKAHSFSDEAKEKIVSAGGKVEVI